MGWHCVQKHCQCVYVLNSYRSRFTSQFALWDSRLGTTSIWLPCDYLLCPSHLTTFVRPETTLQITVKAGSDDRNPQSTTPHLTGVKAWRSTDIILKVPQLATYCLRGEGFRKNSNPLVMCLFSFKILDKTRHLIWAWRHSSIYNQSQYLRKWKKS